jgi:hypothetical protein
VDVLAVRRRGRLLDGLLDAGDERERAARRLVLGAVRDDEDRQPPGVRVAPVPGRLVRPAAADDGADLSHHLR